MRSGYYLILAVVFTLLGSITCGKGTEPPPFKRDPNLQQLTFHDYDQPGAKWRGNTFFPVWAPDDRIYYTRSDFDVNPDHQFGGGDLWVIDRTEETDTLLVKGEFGSLDLSPDGRWLLAVDNFSFYSMMDRAEGILVLFDPSTMEKRIIPTGTLKVLEAAFCPDSTGLAIVYYGYRSSSSPDGYYRIHVDGTDNQLLTIHPSPFFRKEAAMKALTRCILVAVLASVLVTVLWAETWATPPALKQRYEAQLNFLSD